MPQRILGLDVGTWSVKGVVLEDRFRTFRLLGCSEVRVAPGDEPLAERQTEAIRELMAAEPEKVDAIVTGLPAERATVRFVNLPYADTRKVDQTIGGELADVVPFDIDESVSSHEILAKTDGGGSLSLAAIAPFASIEDFLATLSAGGADPRYLGVDTLHLFNLYTHFIKNDASKAESPGTPSVDAGTFIMPAIDGPPDARLIVDVGHERTLLCACGPDGIAYVRAVRAGGADITQQIMKTADLGLAKAETIKHEEGFVASSRHPAPDERAQQISDIIAEGLTPLVRELRRSLQAVRSDRRVRIARIDLLGGGSRVRNLANYLADQLNVPTAQSVAVEQIVEPHIDTTRRPAFAGALASALRVVGDEPTSNIDLRSGDFMFAGSLRHLRARLPAIGIAAVVLLCLLGVNVWASYQTAVAREKAVDAQFCSITKEVIGREICEPKRAISAMQTPATELGAVEFPERSAFNIAAELSERIPKDLDVHIREMSIAQSRAKISGEAPTFDAVDQIVAEYSKDTCYTDIKKGKLRRLANGDRIEFVLSMQLECS